jgi:hypothetical protein
MKRQTLRESLCQIISKCCLYPAGGRATSFTCGALTLSPISPARANPQWRSSASSAASYLASHIS